MANKKGLLLYTLVVYLLVVSLLATIVLTMGYKLKPFDGLSPVRDTTRVTCFDTLYYTECIARDSVVLRYVTAKVPVKADGNTAEVDSVTVQRDSVCIDLPIMQKTYGDSTYTAWVSGYDVTLDSIRVYRREDVVTITEKQPAKRWHIGLTGGYGLCTAGLQPYIGIGVTYSLISF